MTCDLGHHPFTQSSGGTRRGCSLAFGMFRIDEIGVEIEDPGDEIGPEAPGSKNMGLWFHDPDGYRWELSVLGGK